MLSNITWLIQKNHPEKKLEHFFKSIFEKILNVINVENYGETKGFGTDFGADLIVRYKSGLPILDLETVSNSPSNCLFNIVCLSFKLYCLTDSKHC